MTTQSTIGASAQPAGTAPAAKKKSTLLKFAVAAIVVVAVIAWLAHWLAVGRYIESTDDAYVGGDITVIAPKVAGNIETVLVKDNQAVRAGELLVKLDDRDYQAALAKANAAVAAQQAALANLEAERKLQESVIEQGRAGVAASSAETARARDDQARYQSLSAKSAVSLQSAQKADADYKQAQANGQKAQAGLNAAQRQLDVIATQKQRVQAALQQAHAERSLAELNLAYTELRAPVDGVIGNRRARVGAYATIGAQLLSVVPAQGLWVDANFKENQIAHMKEGQAVVIKADVLPGEEFHGRVQSLAPATGAQFSVLPAENATGNFTKIVQRVPVRVALDADAARLGKLRPGLSVTAEVDQRGPRS
ncbi:HlyD family secretion protein [Herbaspirillum sp. WKF16]|uniref:HlyD family secretion protein n=1 Tax=Herbaspirillum sp. WKF16 TaxID=3028312 RepID=UPI0023A9D83E|nr:HlyD family secretion protein [Herbaspirillum sp. WKF16]WDZ95999.1 HlyD family secretion protein [Herbaspirillum sp. WKF16]